jgi:hypothetical protein
MGLGEQLFLAWISGAISMAVLIGIYEHIMIQRTKKPYDWNKRRDFK